MVFCYCSLARFDCARYIKLNNLKFNADYIEVLVERSKTDQAGEGQTMYMLNLPGFNAVKLLANYVFLMDLEGDDYLFPSLKWNKIEKKFGVLTLENPFHIQLPTRAKKRFLKSLVLMKHVFLYILLE